MKTMTSKTRFSMLAVALSLAFAFSAHAAINATITATQTILDSVCGTHNVKVVFTCQNLLYYVDFSEATPAIHQMAGVASPYFPVISSDGKWVTYQTGVQAEGGVSSVPAPGKPWIRSLSLTGTAAKVADTGYVPRFVQNTSADTPEIVYSTSVVCSQLSLPICYSSGQTLKRKIVGGVAQAPEVVFGQGSYYGGLSWDERYLNTGWEGGPNAFILDLQDASGVPHKVHTMRVCKNKVVPSDPYVFDTVSIGTCNISRPASRIFTNTMMYFDFGSGALRTAGCYHPLLGSWSLHEKIFISRYDGEDLKTFAMPSDLTLIPPASVVGIGEPTKKYWDNPEWSNHPYYGAASLEIDRTFKDASTGTYSTMTNREAIYLLDLKDSSYVRLVQVTDTTKTSTTSFGYPFLWVEIPAGFQEDASWLSQTIWERAHIDAVKQNIAPRSRSALSVWSNAKATKIIVYSALGQQIAVLTKSGNKSINISKFLETLRSGIYFIGIESPGQQRQVVRWVSSHQ